MLGILTRVDSGYDGLTDKHVMYTGDPVIEVLVVLSNTVRFSEYIPVCCRVGMQVPLFKGMVTCPLIGSE